MHLVSIIFPQNLPRESNDLANSRWWPQGACRYVPAPNAPSNTPGVCSDHACTLEQLSLSLPEVHALLRCLEHLLHLLCVCIGRRFRSRNAVWRLPRFDVIELMLPFPYLSSFCCLVLTQSGRTRTDIGNLAWQLWKHKHEPDPGRLALRVRKPSGGRGVRLHHVVSRSHGKPKRYQLVTQSAVRPSVRPPTRVMGNVHA